MKHQGASERQHRDYLVTLMSCMGQYWCFTYYHCLFLYLVFSAGSFPDLPRGALFFVFLFGVGEKQTSGRRFLANDLEHMFIAVDVMVVFQRSSIIPSL